MSKINQLLAKWGGCLAFVWLASCSYAQTISQAPLIAAGTNHTLALKSDGSLWAWGSNESGQLGNGTTTNSLSPIRISTGYTSISAGYAQSFGLKWDDTFWAWGNNLNRQFGDNTAVSSLIPKDISDTNFTVIAPGFSHTVALQSDGSLLTWGSNGYGQLGDGTRTDNASPQQIGSETFTAIAVGYSHTVALNTDGSIWAWGYNWAGQLGDGTNQDSADPKQIAAGPFIAIATGASHTVALKSDFTLWVWGNNQSGQLGDGTTTNSYSPKKIGTATYSAIAAGYSHTLALLKTATATNGSLYAWGSNANGQLGDGTRNDSTAPKLIGTATYSAIAAGSKHSVALLKADNSLWAWGSNAFGQVGDGTSTDILAPKKIDSGYTPDTTAPTVPTGPSVLTATSDGTQVNLSWNAATDNIAVTAYKVYLDGNLVATLGNVTSYTGTASTTGQYSVSACDAASNCSDQSEGVLASPQVAVGPTINLGSGWNLLGNSYAESFQVSNVFGDSTKVWAVWKLTAATGKWAFYTPTSNDGGLAYATSKGYDLLTTITGGDGFWVNAKQAFSAQLPAGALMTGASFSSMPSGWNLIAVGDNPTPSRFNSALSVSSSGSNPPSPAVIPFNLNSLWLWDNTLSNWYFYAPSLEAKGGTALTDYITSKGYLDFTANNKTLGVGVGFWVSKP